MANAATNTETVVDTKLQPPSLYDVIFFDDHKTHYEFVVLLLMHIFGKSYSDATGLTDKIAERGREAVATYSYEIAATKRDECISTARANGHPLRVEIEPSSNDGD